MSHSTYNKLWADAQGELRGLLNEEQAAQVSRPEKDRVVFFQRLACLYVRYVQILRKLEEAYDQIVHPQKRRLIREVLDGVMGRVLEVKKQMVEMEFSEYHYMDDVIQDLKLTPADIEIPIPKYFIRERGRMLEEREKKLSVLCVNGIQETVLCCDNANSEGFFSPLQPVGSKPLRIEEAIKMIQVWERARQGRLRSKFMREIRLGEERRRRAKNRDLGPASIDRAVVLIQKVWRGFLQRKQTKTEKEEEMIFLGMAPAPDHNKPCPSVLIAQSTEAKRRQKGDAHEEDFQKSLEVITDKLRELEGPDMRQTMKNQLRQWFIECRDATGKFPDYPAEKDGGSALIFAEKTPQQLLEELAAREEEKDKGKKEGKKLKGKDKSKGKKDKVKEELEEPGLKMLPSAFLSALESGCKTFASVWQNRDETKNFAQRHEVELVKEEKRKEIEAEIREQVDELMRQELANWKLLVDKEKPGKAKVKAKKKKKPGKAKVNAKKKKGSKSGKKEAEDKNLTADRNIESLYEELVEQGLVKMPLPVKLEDYLGDFSYLGTTLRQMDIEPMPSLSDVRQLIALYAVLPLGSQVVHSQGPMVKAILLAGPKGVGKKMLVHAICQETGANLFDLSPLNTAGKYPGNGGLQMMLHRVFKVAKQMQPSVVWIGDTEKIFDKKVPKEEKELDPYCLQEDLAKILKSIKCEDRVLIVGTTENPFRANLKSLCKVYSKVILIPRPDYASRYVMWKLLIRKNGGEVTNALDLSSLAKISDGYTQGHMVQVIRTILTEWRVHKLAKRPLTAAEFVPLLAKIDPVFQDEEEALKNWYAKTPLGKKRMRVSLGREAEEPPVKGGKDVTKKKGRN